MTTTTQPSPATVRKQQAQAARQRLTDERETIVTRQQTAAADLARLDQEILQATRSGEPDTLRGLRDDRRAAEESARDLERAWPVLNRELELAEGEMLMAERACCAEAYNRHQVEQVQLLRTIEDALHAIADALTEKERLAVQQQKVLTSVLPGNNHNAALIRADVIHVVTAWLQGNRGLSLRTADWSSWLMSEQGDLLR